MVIINLSFVYVHTSARRREEKRREERRCRVLDSRDTHGVCKTEVQRHRERRDRGAGQGIERQRRGTNSVRHSRDSSCRSYVETVASGTDSLLVCRIASYIVFVLLMRPDLVAFVRRAPPRINTAAYHPFPLNEFISPAVRRRIDPPGYHRGENWFEESGTSDPGRWFLLAFCNSPRLDYEESAARSPRVSKTELPPPLPLLHPLRNSFALGRN